jgi:hypothetical protein
VSIASVTSDVLHSAVASFWEVAMLSAPVLDSWEGPKRQGAIGDAILGKKFFPAYAHTPPFSTFREKGVRKLFLGNRLRTAPPCFASSLEEQAHGIEAVPARAGQHRRLPLCTSGFCGLSRIAHAHAQKPNDSRRRSSTPIARICINELNRFLSGGSCLHDTDDL